MTDRPNTLLANIDWISILLYTILVLMGWINIYAASYDETHSSILDFSQRYGKQLVWIGASFLLGFLILLTDSKFFTAFSMIIYILTILLLVLVLVIGEESKGARSWFELGGIKIQPAEFAKFATCLAIANVMSRHNFKVMHLPNLLLLLAILALPAGLIILQNDTGSALVYSSFILVFYREGLHGSLLLMCFVAAVLFVISILYTPFTVLVVIICATLFAHYYYRHSPREVLLILLITGGAFALFSLLKWLFGWSLSDFHALLGIYALLSIAGLYPLYKHKLKHLTVLLLVSWMCIGISASVDLMFDKLQPHQQARINELLGITEDAKGVGYNVTQSKIAIGSGGFWGKGFLQGTQTKFNFVPEQSTDFIFCTVGEEWGFVGSATVILLLMAFILRITKLAERQRSAFSRIYGYGVASILFFHVAVNIGMTIGMVPVIGIPLPFFSYGGSSLWAFTILIFIFLRLDSNRLQVFR